MTGDQEVVVEVLNTLTVMWNACRFQNGLSSVVDNCLVSGSSPSSFVPIGMGLGHGLSDGDADNPAIEESGQGDGKGRAGGHGWDTGGASWGTGCNCGRGVLNPTGSWTHHLFSRRLRER